MDVPEKIRVDENGNAIHEKEINLEDATIRIEMDDKQVYHYTLAQATRLAAILMTQIELEIAGE